MNSKNTSHCRGQLKYHTVVTVRTFQIVEMWNVLIIRQCGIITVPDNLECSYCYNSVVF
jgi:hypothetical protein